MTSNEQNKKPPGGQSSELSPQSKKTTGEHQSSETLSQDDISLLPPHLRAVVEQGLRGGAKITVETLESLSAYSGPFPPPELLAEFDRVLPGSARRLLDWTERQIDHRQRLESEQVAGSERRMDRGQIFGFGVALVALIAAVVIATLGPTSWHTSLCAIGVALIGVGGPAAARMLARRFPMSPGPSPQNPKPRSKNKVPARREL
jgi:uncharacterized membrane protein